MQLGQSDEQELLRQAFADLFAAESSPERVRAAEPLGFDPGLWKHLIETGAVGMRVPEAQAGSAASPHDAAIVAEKAGRWIAPAPLLEAIAAADGEAEFAYRLAAATAIYAGSSEIMRSIIAQQALGLPRSRS